MVGKPHLFRLKVVQGKGTVMKCCFFPKKGNDVTMTRGNDVTAVTIAMLKVHKKNLQISVFAHYLKN